MKQRAECTYPDCGQTKHGNRHEGFKADHDYQAPAKEGFGSRGSTLRSRSERPSRVERRQAGSDEAAEHHARVNECEAPAHGITTPCRGRLQHSHRIGKGMGGGKDYALEGECDILCEQHHAEIDMRRAEMRAAGLSKRAPVPDKVPPRRSATPKAETPPAPVQQAQRRPRSRL